MSNEFPSPLYQRLRRIHELERAADSQRERLRLHTAELVAQVRGGGIWREAVGGLLSKVTANAGPLGAMLRSAFLRFSGTVHENGKKKFPSFSAVMAGLAAARLTSWWKHRFDEQRTPKNGFTAKSRM